MFVLLDNGGADMSRYDGLIIPRSYSEYINKTDAATLQQALQLSGVLSGAVAAGDNKAVKSSAVNNALSNFNLFPYHSKRANAKFDELQDTGKFYIQLVTSDSEGTFPQGVVSGVVLTYTWDGPYATQIFIEEDVQRRIYVRYNDGGTPNAWKQLAFI